MAPSARYRSDMRLPSPNVRRDCRKTNDLPPIDQHWTVAADALRFPHKRRVRARAPLVLAGIALLLAVISVGATPTPRLAGIHKIQHVVVIMQENRSFDQLLRHLSWCRRNPARRLYRPIPTHGGCVGPYHDPSELNWAGRTARQSAIADIDGGKMDGFVAQAGYGRNDCVDPNNPACGDGARPSR